MTRVKTFDSSGVAPNGRLFAGDLNAIQDQYADLTNLGQTVSVGAVIIGETALQLSRFGTKEARISGAFRTDGIIRGLGGLFAGSFTTSARDAIAVGSRPTGLIIFNTTNNRLEINLGSDATPNWQPISQGVSPGTITTTEIQDGTIQAADLASNSVQTAKIVDDAVTFAKLNSALKPSLGAGAAAEALRALGTTGATAAAGNDSRLSDDRATIAAWRPVVVVAGQKTDTQTYTITAPAAGSYMLLFGAGDFNEVGQGSSMQISSSIGGYVRYGTVGGAGGVGVVGPTVLSAGQVITFTVSGLNWLFGCFAALIRTS